jgi:hypothetical protein
MSIMNEGLVYSCLLKGLIPRVVVAKDEELLVKISTFNFGAGNGKGNAITMSS